MNTIVVIFFSFCFVCGTAPVFCSSGSDGAVRTYVVVGKKEPMKTKNGHLIRTKNGNLVTFKKRGG